MSNQVLASEKKKKQFASECARLFAPSEPATRLGVSSPQNRASDYKITIQFHPMNIIAGPDKLLTLIAFE